MGHPSRSAPKSDLGAVRPLEAEVGLAPVNSLSELTNRFHLDAAGRPRQREQAGGAAGIEIFHYDGPGDPPPWTSLGATWSRNIPGIGGELAAVQETSGTTTFKLTDLHGDAVASASSSPTALKLLATYRHRIR
jgi:hypothetical protein